MSDIGRINHRSSVDGKRRAFLVGVLGTGALLRVEPAAAQPVIAEGVTTLIVCTPHLAGKTRVVRVRTPQDMAVVHSIMGSNGWCIPLE